jgi:hypothetical protein
LSPDRHALSSGAFSGRLLYARHVYSWRDIRWHHRYKDVTSVSPQERFLLDYTKFHDVVADE